MNFNIKHLSLLSVIVLNFVVSYGQSAWPSVSWSNGVNISAALPASTAELSGLYWNSATNRLYCAGDEGSIYILQYSKGTNQYTLLGSASNKGAPEGITQVDNAANEFYTIDENSYEIRKYTYSSGFSNFSKVNSWNLLSLPSPMTNTDNTGPEGICFVPDSYLQKTGFISSATGLTYSSKKGMGGLLFIAHQDGGYVWVFDVNPAVSNDFLYVGKYLTNRTESCDVAFDNSTGLMYILHNTDGNSLEVTDLKTSVTNGVYKLNMLKEYSIPNPASGSDNIEGFAISPKYPRESSLGVWLCRDVTKTSELTDALKWFNPYSADGTSLVSSLYDIERTSAISIFPNAADNLITISVEDKLASISLLNIFDSAGQLIERRQNIQFPYSLNVQNYNPGIYFISIITNGHLSFSQKFIKR